MKKKEHFHEKLSFRRKLIQVYAALLYNAHIKGYIEGNIYTGKGKMLCVPGLNCYSCPGAAGACPLGALQNALAAAGKKAPHYMLGILLLFGITFGRTICGWLCPVGLVQELLYHIPGPKLKKSKWTRILSYLKYVILAVFVVFIPLYYGLKDVPLPAFCKYICPAGTLGGAVQLLAHPANADKFSMLGIYFTRKWVILLLLILLSIFIYRVFCRFLCPLGAIYGLFNRYCLIGIRVNEDRCTHCGKCVMHCPMDTRYVGDHECIHCGKCIRECPNKAISLKAGKITLTGGDAAESGKSHPLHGRKRFLLPAAMILLLCTALITTNLSNKQNITQSGSEVGQTPKDFTLTTTENESFHLEEYRGKTVVINLWATWCTPCVRELPYFEQLHQAHPDDVEILAIHSDMVTDDVKKYLSGYNYTFSFAIDETGDVINALGGSTMLPQTIIINKDGVVTYNTVGSVTYDKLEKLISEAEKQ